MAPSGRRNLLILPHGPLTHTPTPHTPSHWRMAFIVLIALTTLATPTAGQVTVDAQSPLLVEAGSDEPTFTTITCGFNDNLGEVTFELSVTSDNADNVTIEPFASGGVDFNVGFVVAGDYDFLCEASTPNGVVATGTASVEVNEFFDERIPEASIFAVSPVIKDSLSESFTGSVTCSASVRSSSYVLTITSANADQATIVETENKEIFDVSYIAGGLFDFLCIATTPFGLQGNDTATVEVLERRLLTIEADTDIDRDFLRGETPSGFVNCTAPDDLGDVTYELTATSGNVVSIVALDDNGTFNVTHGTGGDFLCTATNADGVVAAGTTQVTLGDFFDDSGPVLTAIAEEKTVIIDPTSGQPATGNIICSDPSNDRSFPLPLISTNLDVVDVIIGNTDDVTIEMTDPFGVFLVTYNAPGVFILNCSAGTAIGISDADSVTVAVVEGDPTLLVEADSPIILLPLFEVIEGTVNCSTTDLSDEGECVLLDVSSNEESANIVDRGANGELRVDYDFYGTPAGIVELICICTDPEGAQRYGRTRVEVLDGDRLLTIEADTGIDRDRRRGETPSGFVNCSAPDDLGDVTYELTLTNIPSSEFGFDRAQVSIVALDDNGTYNVTYESGNDFDFLCTATNADGVIAARRTRVTLEDFFDDSGPNLTAIAEENTVIIDPTSGQPATGNITCSDPSNDRSFPEPLISTDLQVTDVINGNADNVTIEETDPFGVFLVTYNAPGVYTFTCSARVFSPFRTDSDNVTVVVVEGELLTIEADTDILRDIGRGETPSGFVNCTAPDDFGDVTYELTATSGSIVSIVALDDNGTFNVTYETGGGFLCTATNADGVVAAGTTQVTVVGFFADPIPVLTAIAEENPVLIDPTSGQPATGNIICSDPSNDRSFPLPLVFTNLDVVDVIIGNAGDVTIEMTDPFGVFLVTYNAPGVFILNCSANTAAGGSDADSVTVAVVEGFDTLLVEADSPITLGTPSEEIVGNVNCSTTDQSEEGECILLDLSSDEDSATIVGNQQTNGDFQVDYGEFSGIKAGIVEFYCICTDPEGAQRYGRTRVEVLDEGCADDFCENGGTCVPVSDEIDDGFRCSCQEGYMGDRCETAISCPDDFCENGGTCEAASDDLTKAFRCVCPQGYSGDSCENCETCETSPDQCVCRLLGDPIVETFVAGEFSLLTKAKLFTLSEQRKGDCAFSVEVQIGDYGNGGLIVPKYLTVTLNGGKTVVQFNDDHQFEVLKSKTNSAGVYDGRGRKFKLDNVGYEVDVIRNGDFLVIIDNVCGTKVGYDSEGLYTTATIVVAKNNSDGLKGECGDCGNY